jgi:hypothetical protein
MALWPMELWHPKGYAIMSHFFFPSWDGLYGPAALELDCNVTSWLDLLISSDFKIELVSILRLNAK